MMLNNKLLVAGFVMAAFSQAPAQAAGTLTGQVGVQMVIGAGCSVTNGTVDGSGVNQWGTLDFGTHPDLANAVDADIAGTSGNIQIQCSTGLTPSMMVNAGLHSDGNQRNMQNTAGSENIAYSLYSDAARSASIDVDAPVALTAAVGAEMDIPLYGRVVPTGQSSTVPPTGTYTDTLLVTLTW